MTALTMPATAASHDPCIPDAASCGEPGRRMFFEHVGRYFAAAPRLRPLPQGTVCSLCGSASARLWLTTSGEASCIAQQTITRKRAARASAAQPLVPAPNPQGMSNMGDGTFIVAGPRIALIVTKLLPDREVPSSVRVVFSEPGRVREARIALVREPPEPPFVVITCEKKAGFRTRITVDASRIAFCGPSGYVVDRPYLGRLLRFAERIGIKPLLDLAALRQRLAAADYGAGPGGEAQRRADQDAYLALRSSNALSAAEFRSLPPPRSSEFSFLRQLGE